MSQLVGIRQAARIIDVPVVSLWNYLQRHPEITRTQIGNSIAVNLDDCLPFKTERKPRKQSNGE